MKAVNLAKIRIKNVELLDDGTQEFVMTVGWFAGVSMLYTSYRLTRYVVRKVLS